MHRDILAIYASNKVLERLSAMPRYSIYAANNRVIQFIYNKYDTIFYIRGNNIRLDISRYFRLDNGIRYGIQAIFDILGDMNIVHSYNKSNIIATNNDMIDEIKIDRDYLYNYI